MTLSLLTFSLLISLSLSNPDFTTLLSFKLSSDTSSSLPWSSSSPPCSWLGVTCNPMTHRVTKLVLNNLNLTGSLQPLTRLTHLRHLSLHHNSLSKPPSHSSWPNLKHLYLSHNRFSGKFPPGVSNLRRLLRLDLSHNHFSGEIPVTELTQLPHLLTLHLEFNSFTGNISGSGGTSSLVEFNVSNNDLTGKIPGFLLSFPVSSFVGNVGLCGKPLPLHCYNNNTNTGHSKPTAGHDGNGKTRVLDTKKNVKNRILMMIISVNVVVVILIFIIVTMCCYSKTYRYRYAEKKMKVKEYCYSGKYGDDDQEILVCFEGCKGFDKVSELLMASAEMLAKGSVGTTYKVAVEGGDAVVVKRVRCCSSSSRVVKKKIDVYLKDKIGVLRNPNVLSLRAFCCSKNELLLVYDFLPNGSLSTLLHGNRGPGRTPLDWNTRLKVSSGIAQGIAFLHSHALVHGYLKSSNIIVDHLGNPCISDIGLNLLLQTPLSSNNPSRAPELAHTTTHTSKSYTKKCDVYSFGVILLEILTGKPAWIEGEGNLVNWVARTMRQENWTWEVFDFEMVMYKEMQGEMKALLQVALLCLVSSPNQRLEMIVVKKMIDDVKVGDSESCGSILNGHSSGSSSSFSENL